MTSSEESAVVDMPPSPSSARQSKSNGLAADAVGVVVIGRNEGERLRRCVRSLLDQGAGPIVYVDSGSTDGSVDFVQAEGLDVVRLDTSVPFTMARGRNAGFQELRSRYPSLRWVQFVDGDCEVQPDWIAAARAALAARPEVAAVCGRRRERFPEASIYNRLADIEWDGPIGEVEECGGDALFRTPVFAEAGGFNPRMIAGEEPELCVRLRNAGYQIVRLPIEMTLHDASMLHFSQWWKRAIRSGHSFAEGMAMHGSGPTRHNVRRTLSALAYGCVLPGLFVQGAVLGACGIGWGPLHACVLVAVPVAFARAWLGAYRGRRGRGDPRSHAALYASFCMLGKFPEAIGIATYWSNRLRGRYSGLMEYKQDTGAGATPDGEGSSRAATRGRVDPSVPREPAAC